MPRDDLLRFVTTAYHPPYGHRSGIFQAAYAVAKHGEDTPVQAELRMLLGCFRDNLAEPTRLTASRYPRAQETAISWIRASADEHVTRLRDLAALIETFDKIVEELRTTRPGYVVYEDEHQVVALPFADTPR